MRFGTLKGAAALVLVAGLAACTAPTGGDVITANQAQAAQSVQYGTVVSARNVVVQGGGGEQLLGAVVGGVAGAALGNEVGRGTGQDVATVLGGTAGVAAGQAAGRAAGSRNSIEWTVQLESGQTIAVVQASPTFSIGQRVQVISGGGTTRLAAA
jgi:outer membrane lipoprotein SlyB